MLINKKEIFDEYINSLPELIQKYLKDADLEVVFLGEKATVCHVTLPNGMEFVGKAFAAYPKNFSVKIRIRTAIDDIVDQIWPIALYEEANKVK